LVEPTQLLEPPHWADQRVSGLQAARPMARDLDVLTVCVHAHCDLVQHQPGNRLTVLLRGGGPVPQRRHVFGKEPDGFQFRWL
jgi:hypothetical protein